MHVIDSDRTGTSNCTQSVCRNGFNPHPLDYKSTRRQKQAHVHSNCIVHENKSEMDLCATVIDRFLANMLKQMERKGIECDSNCTADLFVSRP